MVALIQLAVDTVKYLHPAAKKVIIQSDGESGFASKEIIPFFFNMNTRLDDKRKLCWADGYSHNHRQKKHDCILTIHFSIKIFKHMWWMTMIYSLKMIF